MSATDLFPFLNDKNPEVITLALEGLEPFSQESSHFDQPVVARLAALATTPNSSHAVPALNILINLTASQVVCTYLKELQPNFVQSVVQVIASNSVQSSLGCMLLSNLSKNETLAMRLVEFLPLLFPLYMSTGALSQRLQLLGSVFADLSTIPAGRIFLLTSDDTQETPLHSLMSFVDHSEVIRRGGAVTTLKNCAFDTSKHGWMLDEGVTVLNVNGKDQTCQGLNVLPSLMLRLIRKDIPVEEQDNLPTECQLIDFSTHKPEMDPQILLLIVQTLIMLCTEQQNRQKLRKADVFVVVKELHLQLPTENSPVVDSIHTLVNLLKREDAQE